ncbi:unnamed protein product [Ambrosiozyma monospora]|uniref:Unnamed protein product n=1 Tax=Ambrosiozyma monospora TaxID=43982 RepID=A0ACB5TKW1_AMBMO|nr:unnamed protein product [Ambrosiozyma monospora]
MSDQTYQNKEPPAPPNDLSTVLSFQPLEYLIPKQDIIPFSAPFELQLPEVPLSDSSRILSDTISNGNSESIMEQVLAQIDTEPMDLKYVRFKRPALKLDPNDTIQQNAQLINHLQQLNQLDQLIFNKTSDVQRSDYVKPNTKVKRIKLLNDMKSDDIDLFMESAINAEQLRIKSEMNTTVPSTVGSFDSKNIEQMDNNLPLSQQSSKKGNTEFFSSSPSKQQMSKRLSSSPQKRNSNSSPVKNGTIANPVHIEKGEMEDAALGSIQKLIQSIGLTDDDIESEEVAFWVVYNEVLSANNLPEDTFILNIETLQSLEESLTRLWFSKTKLDFLDVDYMVRMEELIFKTLKSIWLVMVAKLQLI